MKTSLEQPLTYREHIFGTEFLRSEKVAVRLHCPGETIPGLAIDLFGSVVLLTVYEGQYSNHGNFTELIDILRTRYNVQSFVEKRFRRGRNFTSQFSNVIWGEPPPETLTIEETDKHFLIRPNDGFSCGLFLDQRENRKALSERVQPGARVLNLFCYTASFSLYCATRGAQTTNIDISPKALEWAKDNFRANSLSLDGHYFLRRDAVDVLRSLEQKGSGFDLVIVDPPTFSRGPDGKIFRIEIDWLEIVQLASRVCNPQGYLFLSSNYQNYIHNGFPKPAPAIPFSRVHLPPPPPDFSTAPATVITELWQRQ